MIPPDFRTWAEIDLSAIRHNLRFVREKIGPAPAIIAVIKANAYGHGMLEVAGAIKDLASLFGVANVEEALALKGFRQDILLLSPCLPAERREAVGRNYIATVSSAAEAAEFSGGRINFEVDTGMGRIGCWQDHAVAELEKIVRLPEVRLHSISTHLPSADDDEEYTLAQLERFGLLVAKFRTLAPAAKIHVLNSAGTLRFSDHAHDLVRPGLMLYGSAYPAQFQPSLRPALTWKTRVLLVRELERGRSVSYGRTFTTTGPTRVASLAVGYADGFPRQASGAGADVLIGGHRCPVLGRMTMDQILADVTAVPAAKTGDEAVLIGRQGAEEILAAELAARAGTIAWDIFTGLKGRVRKLYF